MTLRDTRGCAVSGATPAALDHYERAVARLLAWQAGTDAAAVEALEQAPGFTMAHVLRAYLLVCSRDPQRVRAAGRLWQNGAYLPANPREAAHWDVIRAVLADDYGGARVRLGDLLQAHPRDVLALHVAHSLDYSTGDVDVMRRRIANVLPAWSRDLPGYHAVLAMQAFGLVESGDPERGEDAAHAALALDPHDARAHHALAHAFETTDRAEAGLRWMATHEARWAPGTVIATHGWWHVALFHLALARTDRALQVYDRQVRGTPSLDLADLIDAASLLWRVELQGGDAGPRWTELAQAWAPRIDEHYCSFSDVHAMLAFVGARDWAHAARLEATLTDARLRQTRHGATTLALGLRACRGLLAYGRGELALAIGLLASLPARAHRLGGSHAQRDVLHLTLVSAVERMRRPARRRLAAQAA